MSLQTWQETLVSSATDGPALTAAAAASCLPAEAKIVLLPDRFRWSVGKALRISASGRISSVITTPGTARFDVRLGGNVVFDGLAVLLDSVAAHANAQWRLALDLVCTAIGTSATLEGSGAWTCEDILGVPATAPKGVLTAMLPWNTAPGSAGGTFDSTASAGNVLDLFFTQTVATGSMTLHRYLVESLN